MLPSYHVYMVCEKTGNLVPMQTQNVLASPASVLTATELETRLVMPQSSGSIAADQNPFSADSRGRGQTTVSWMTYWTSSVEVRVDAPDGLLFARTGPVQFRRQPVHGSATALHFIYKTPRAACLLLPRTRLPRLALGPCDLVLDRSSMRYR